MELLKQNLKTTVTKEDIINAIIKWTKEYISSNRDSITFFINRKNKIEKSEMIKIITNLGLSTIRYKIKIDEFEWESGKYVINIHDKEASFIKNRDSIHFPLCIGIEENIIETLNTVEIPVCLDGYAHSVACFYEIFKDSKLESDIRKRKISLILKNNDNSIILPVTKYKYDKENEQFKIVTIIDKRIFEHADRIIVTAELTSNKILGIVGFEGLITNL